MTKIIERFRCWRSSCKLKLPNKWFTREELERTPMDEGHVDYNCPECGSVIICSKEVKE